MKIGTTARTTTLLAVLIGTLALVKPDGLAIAKSTLTAMGLDTLRVLSNSDGTHPAAGLIIGIDSNLYGANNGGGTNYGGTFYKVVATGDYTNPTVTYSVLHNFGDGSVTNDGTNCNAKKLAKDASGYIYGTCWTGGAYGNGVIYRIHTHTGAVTILHSFNSGSSGNNAYNPGSGLVRDGSGVLYGTASIGGGTGYSGVIYKLVSGFSGWTYTILYRFSTGSSNGYYPTSITLGTDGKLYGLTTNGGANSGGVIWRYTPSTSTYTKLIDMPSGTTLSVGGLTEVPPYYTGNGPLEFWGATYQTGGMYNLGSVYKIAETSAGSGSFNYTTMYSFDSTGARYPMSDLVFTPDLNPWDAHGVFYGTTETGTLYRLDLSGTFSEPPVDPSWTGGYPANTPYGLVEGLIGGGGYPYTPVLFGCSVVGGSNNNGWLWNIWLQ